MQGLLRAGKCDKNIPRGRMEGRSIYMCKCTTCPSKGSRCPVLFASVKVQRVLVIGAHLLRTSPTVQFFSFDIFYWAFFCASQRITHNPTGSFWLKKFQISNFYHIPHDAEAFLGSPKLLIPKTEFSGPSLFQAPRAD